MPAPTVSIKEKLRSLGAPPWAKKINGLTQERLLKVYPREARIHRDLIRSGAPAPSSWRNFRQFMYDVGPCPEGEDYVLAVTNDTLRVYDRGKVAWTKADTPGVYYWVAVEGSSTGHWNRAARHVDFARDPLGDLLRPPSDMGELGEANSWAPTDPRKLAAFTDTFKQWQHHGEDELAFGQLAREGGAVQRLLHRGVQGRQAPVVVAHARVQGRNPAIDGLNMALGHGDLVVDVVFRGAAAQAERAQQHDAGDRRLGVTECHQSTPH